MKVAFVSEHAPGDVNAFSGIPFFMRRHLDARSAIVTSVHSPMVDLGVVLSNAEKGLAQLRAAGTRVSAELRRSPADVVLCQGSSMIPFLKTDKLVVLWHDSTWRALMQLSREVLERCHPVLAEWDRRVLDVCDLIAFASDWVRDDTVPYPHRSQLEVVPFGPSLFDASPGEIEASIMRRSIPPCQLAFVGVDWIRKGLPLAHAVTNELDAGGLPTVLEVLGCNLDTSDASSSAWHAGRPFHSSDLQAIRLQCDPAIRLRGFLQKGRPIEYRRFHEILRSTHFLIHPSSFECFGVALTEANALGVPVVATDSFGPRSIVRHRVNGWVFPPEDFVSRAVEAIGKTLTSDEKYRAKALAALEESRRRLNWASATDRLLTLIEGM